MEFEILTLLGMSVDLSIGVWMMKEIDRVRGGLANDLTPMIEINELIRDGLK